MNELPKAEKAAPLRRILAATGFLLCGAAVAQSYDFDGLRDREALTTQLAGATFANATALTAGMSLDAAQYPPRSGLTVVSNLGQGAMTITFADVVGSFHLYLTHDTQIDVHMLSITGAELPPAGIRTNFVNNTALSGDPGSFPNELVAVIGSLQLKTLVLQPTEAGGFFTLDDLSVGPIESPIPEPSSLWLLAVGLGVLAMRGEPLRNLVRRRRTRARRAP